MSLDRTDKGHSALVALEAAAISARSGFGCMFSSSDEYETALITQRRAQGRYAPPARNWRPLAFAMTAVIIAGAVICFS